MNMYVHVQAGNLKYKNVFFFENKNALCLSLFLRSSHSSKKSQKSTVPVCLISLLLFYSL